MQSSWQDKCITPAFSCENLVGTNSIPSKSLFKLMCTIWWKDKSFHAAVVQTLKQCDHQVYLEAREFQNSGASITWATMLFCRKMLKHSVCWIPLVCSMTPHQGKAVWALANCNFSLKAHMKKLGFPRIVGLQGVLESDRIIYSHPYW